MIPEQYFERRQVRAAIEFAEGGGIAVHRNFDHYDGRRSGRGPVMSKPFLHVIGRRPLLEEWGRVWGLRPEWIQPEKRRRVAHFDVFGEFAERLIERLTMARNPQEEFRRFASVQSSLYSRLSAEIAEDPDLLALAANAPAGQPAPNLLFAAVHYLLLKGARHRLAEYYPTVGGSRAADDGLFANFGEFCREQAAAIVLLLQVRRVQTNEVARSASLLPAFETVSRRAGRPLALVEIGTSAGLNLNFDLYAYDYGRAGRVGTESNPVQLAAEVRGDVLPPLPGDGAFPEVGHRTGIDISPVDVTDSDQALWLQALVWPDQPWRADLLRAAIRAALDRPPPLVTGDAVDVLPELLAGIPDGLALTVFHSYAVYQFSFDARERLTQLLAAEGARRDLYRVSLEWFVSDRPLLELTAWEGGRRSETVLAACHHHGQWLHWLAGQASS